jgi:hypothetical protein
MYQARQVSVPSQESECTKPENWMYQARKVGDHVYSCIDFAQLYDISGRLDYARCFVFNFYVN